jgi:hypothetical protein
MTKRPEVAHDFGVFQASALGRSLSDETVGLRFNGHDDALRFAREFAERGKEWAKLEGVRSSTEEYLEGKAEISVNLDLAIGGKSRHFKFVVKLGPPVDDEGQWTLRGDDGLHEATLVFERHAEQVSVFLDRKSSHSPERPIPVVVRLEVSAKVDDLRVEVAASSLDFPVKVFGVLANGEVKFVGAPGLENFARAANSLVQGVPEIVDDARRQDADLGRQASFESQLDDLVAGLRIAVCDEIIVATLDEGLADRFKIRNAFFSHIDY